MKPSALRYYLWLIEAFVKKHFVLVIIGIIFGLGTILAMIKYLPRINVSNSSSSKVIGVVGSYLPHTLPDDIRFLYTSSLIKLSPEGELVPILINSFETFDSNKRFRIHLKSNTVWSDSKAFDAKDIDIQVSGVEKKIIDNKTVDFILPRPLATFPILLTRPIMKDAYTGIGGQYTVSKYTFDKNGKLESIVLRPNKSGLAPLVYKFFSSEDDLVLSYKLGRISEFITSDSKVADQLLKNRNTTVKREEDFSSIMTVFFNTKNPFLSLRENRRALAQLIPNMTEWGILAQGPIPPSSWAFSPEIKHLAPNTTRAMSILTPETLASQSAPLRLYTFYENRDVANLIKVSLVAAGVKVDLRLSQGRPEEFDMLLANWSPPRDPDQYFIWHSTQSATNLTGVSSPKVDLLLEEGRRLINSAQRKKIYWDFQKALVDEAPAHFLFYPYRYKISRK